MSQASAPPMIAQMFNRIHARYDHLNRVLSLGLDATWRRRAVRESGLGPGDSVVDLCCGTGDLSAELARCVGPRGRVVGVDFAELMLQQARLKLPQLEFIQADVLQVPLPGGFDAVTIAFGPRNIPDLPGLWREVRRLLRPGGRLVSLELTRPRGLLGWLHALYLRWVLPVLGALLAGDGPAYRYLSKTVAAFLDREALSQTLREAGFCQVESIPLSGGIVTIHRAVAP